jgi:hypothetical protein
MAGSEHKQCFSNSNMLKFLNYSVFFTFVLALGILASKPSVPTEQGPLTFPSSGFFCQSYANAISEGFARQDLGLSPTVFINHDVEACLCLKGTDRPD